MQYTSKLSLRKPEGTDVAEVGTHIGENAQILDDILKGILEGTQALDKIKLRIGTTDVLSEGEMSFDEENGTISYGMAGGVIQQIGEEVFYKVKNQTGATLQNGKAIRSDGSLGLSANMKGTYAIANGTMPPRYILGIATQDIPKDLDGRVTFFGVVRHINTTGADVGETWAAGDLLYVHPTTAGALTKVPPIAPKPKIQVAMVLTVSATVGAIFVKPDSGFYLEDLHNMYITSLADGDILTYDGTNLRWKNVGKNSVFSFLTNIGDLIYASGVGTPARLAAGTANKLLKSGGTTNAPVWEDIGLVVNALTAKATPVDADSIMMVDSAASNVGKKATWTQIKAFLKTYFDTLYNLYTHPTGDGNLHVPANSTTNNNKILKANATAGSYSWTDIGLVLNGLPAKATPVNADSIGIVDSAAGDVGKKTTWANIKATLQTYFDTVYAFASHTHSYLPLSGGSLTGNLQFGADLARNKSIMGTYDSSKIQQIWSMGGIYVSSEDGLNFGQLYGLAYKYDASAYAGGHQAVWAEGGAPRVALGANIWTSGNVTAYSDRRVKTNIELIPNALEKVMLLNGYTFDRTDIETKRQTGVIAQEVLAVLPEAVTGDSENYSVAYGNLVGLLIEAIKEQQKQIDELKAKVM